MYVYTYIHVLINLHIEVDVIVVVCVEFMKTLLLMEATLKAENEVYIHIVD